MSLDDVNEGDAPAPAGGVSKWFLAVPIALAIVVAALAYFLLSPGDEELMTTSDKNAVAVAVANARPPQ